MPRKVGQVALSIPMSRDEIASVHSAAKRRGYAVTADYVRALLERDIQSDDRGFRFEINRGGDRRLNKEDEIGH